jgi:predicted nucleic acid-binding protein
VSAYFLDTSAIVKRYAPEPGQAWVRSLHNPARGHALFIAQVALAEVVATLCRKERQGVITRAERDTLIDAFHRSRRASYDMVRVTDAVYTAAGNLCRSHNLRAYDAVQLACALAVHVDALARNIPAPTFVCADNDLLVVATAEGLAVVNPNNYP